METSEGVPDAAAPARTDHGCPASLWAHAAVAANLLAQLTLIGLILAMLFLATDDTYLLLYGTWCGVGTVYVVTVGAVVSAIARGETSPERAVPRFPLGRTARTTTALTTISGCVIGLAGAFQARLPLPDARLDSVEDALGVWAMLVSWALLHWGFAQSYFRRYHASGRPTLDFPATERPRLSDFVYFAVTVGTSFAVSDTKIVSPAVRWTVTWHSVLSFLFNGAIIVIAFNKLTGSG